VKPVTILIDIDIPDDGATCGTKQDRCHLLRRKTCWCAAFMRFLEDGYVDGVRVHYRCRDCLSAEAAVKGGEK